MCMEIFSKLLDAAFMEGKIKFHRARERIRLTHLCFANDHIIFSDASPYSLQGISHVLHEFYVLSGLQVSFEKYELYCCSVSEENQFALASLLGMKLGKLLVKYLGVPLISGRLKDDDCQPLIDKITVRIKSWTSKFLSFPGRLQLIDSALNHMINYWLSVFLLRKKIIRAVERLCNSFLWSGVLDSTHGAKVKWSSVCLPKTEEGLDLKDLYIWNIANIARQVWLIFSEAGSLWIAWVHAILLKKVASV